MNWSNFKRAELTSRYRVFSSKLSLYYLLIERVSIVTSRFIQHRAQVQVELNQASIERVVEQIDLFTTHGTFRTFAERCCNMHGTLHNKGVGTVRNHNHVIEKKKRPPKKPQHDSVLRTNYTHKNT
jgi:hypothetical protein